MSPSRVKEEGRPTGLELCHDVIDSTVAVGVKDSPAKGIRVGVVDIGACDEEEVVVLDEFERDRIQGPAVCDLKAVDSHVH